MDWLKTHEFLAAWMNLPLIIVLAIYQRIGGSGEQTSMARMVVYLAFFTCLAAIFTPGTNGWAQGVAMVMGITLMKQIIDFSK